MLLAAPDREVADRDGRSDRRLVKDYRPHPHAGQQKSTTANRNNYNDPYNDDDDDDNNKNQNNNDNNDDRSDDVSTD